MALVARRKKEIVTADGLTMTVVPSTISKKRPFQKIRDYLFARRYIRIEIPAILEPAVEEFLLRYHAKQDISFDCYSFVTLVCGMEPHKVRYMLRFWETKPFERKPKAGDIIFLIDKNKHRFHHAAVCIGQGLYLSVYGAGGDLEIATLEDMERDFASNAVLKAKPLKKRAQN